VLAALTSDKRTEQLERLVMRFGAPRESLSLHGGQLVAWPGPVAARLTAQAALYGTRESGDWASAHVGEHGIVLESGPLAGRPWFVATGAGLATTHLGALLVALGPAVPALDRTFLAALSTGDWPADATRSPREGVRTLGPGLRCRVHRGRASALERAVAPALEPLDPRGAVTALRRALEGAVHRALGARTAVSVSGGLDSTGVLAFAAREQPDVLAMALDFDEPGRDAEHRDVACAHLRVPVRLVAPEAGGAHVLSTMIVDALPTAWPTAPLEIELARAARAAGATVVLTGNGGDDVLDGDPVLVARSLRRDPVATLRSLLALRGPGLPPPLCRLRSWVLGPRARAMAPLALRRLRDAHALRTSMPWLRRDAARLLATHDRGDERDRYQTFASGHWLTGVSVFRHQVEVASGVARRDPLLDPELVRFVLALPPEALFAGGWTRGLYREVLRDLLPESMVFRSTKGGFEPGFRRMVEAAGGFTALAPLARVRRLADLGIVEPRRFRTAWESLVSAPDDARWIDVWPALSVEAFLASVDDAPHA
jgi:asparagine synthase (glutamine-hydrolysing)